VKNKSKKVNILLSQYFQIFPEIFLNSKIKFQAQGFVFFVFFRFLKKILK